MDRRVRPGNDLDPALKSKLNAHFILPSDILKLDLGQGRTLHAAVLKAWHVFTICMQAIEQGRKI